MAERAIRSGWSARLAEGLMILAVFGPQALLADDDAWHAPLKDFDEAALEARVAGHRAVVRKHPKDPGSRDGLADAAVSFALASEVARALGDTALADGYLQFVAARLSDTLWRVENRAGKGDAGALAALAVFREHAVVIERDPARACEAWEAAAARENALGQYRSALCVAQLDQDRSLAYMRAAADQGHPAAQQSLAEVCMALDPPDFGCAVRWAGAAAMQGRVPAQGLIGWLHFSGQVSGLSNDQALAFLEAAAASGDPAAINNLGQVLESGAGGEARKQEAAALYQAAAREGFAPAQFNLGRLYVLGQGVDRNIGQARLWLTLAEDGGVAEAGEMLEWLSRQEGDAEGSDGPVGPGAPIVPR